MDSQTNQNRISKFEFVVSCDSRDTRLPAASAAV